MANFIVVDVGTGGVHASVVSGDGLSIAASRYERVVYREGPGGGKDFDPDGLFAIVASLARGAIEEAGVGARYDALVVTSQRHGAVFLDGRGQTVLACPNVDARAAATAAAFAAGSGAAIYSIAARWPAPFFPALRLAWLRENDRPAFATIARVLMINEWLAWRLTGRMASEPTNAAETLLFDPAKGEWSRELAGIFGLESIEMNDLLPPGSVAGALKADAARALGLPEGLPVRLAHADTQAAAIGCGALEAGDVVVVNGSTTPIVRVAGDFVLDEGRRVWTTPYAEGLWLVEANANRSGMIYRALVDSCAAFVAGLAATAGAKLDEAALAERIRDSIGPADGALGSWGPRISDVSRSARPGSAMFLDPGRDPFGSILPSFVENLAFAVRENVLLVDSVAGKPGGDIRLTGGGSANDRFASALAALLPGRRILRALDLETTTLGAVASVHMAECGGILSRDLAKDLADRFEAISPAKDAEGLAERASRWKDFYLETTRAR